MIKFDYDELFNLLLNMESSSSLKELSEKLYCSSSKCSKMIKDYENRLKLQLYSKNSEYLLSSDGKELLQEIEKPLMLLRQITKLEHDIVGIDESLIGEFDDQFGSLKIQYYDSSELIELYKNGRLDKIVVSSDFEQEFKFNHKKLIINKPVYHIKAKDDDSKYTYANNQGCPIRKKLEANNIRIDETLKQSVAICKMVRLGKGQGYTFNTYSLDPNQIDIQKVKDLAVTFNLYSKY